VRHTFSLSLSVLLLPCLMGSMGLLGDSGWVLGRLVSSFSAWLHGAEACRAHGESVPIKYYDNCATVSICIDLVLLIDICSVAGATFTGWDR